MSDYRVTLAILEYRDCTLKDGWIGENVGLQRCQTREVLLYVCMYVQSQTTPNDKHDVHTRVAYIIRISHRKHSLLKGVLQRPHGPQTKFTSSVHR